jgi:hypothetical protein
MVSPEEAEVLRAQDRVLEEIVAELDRWVGRGEWALALTADHGQTPQPETTGGLRIHPDLLGRKVDEYFGRKIVQKVTPSGLFLDPAAIRESGITPTDVARFVAQYRYGDGLPADVDRSEVPQDVLDTRVFAATIPSTYLAGLTEEEAAGLGAGDYPEGNLTGPAEVPL